MKRDPLAHALKAVAAIQKLERGIVVTFDFDTAMEMEAAFGAITTAVFAAKGPATEAHVITTEEWEEGRQKP